MAEQTNNQQINEEQEGCIPLVRCISATDEERKDPRYIPKLEIDARAQEIISERFESPISIIALVGKVGVGKSKLASLTVETLHRTVSNPPLRPFRSGKGGTRVTQGIWMWSEPLRHPDENQKGSILLLDCEGMGESDKETGNNLYLFCMIMSTAFAVVLRTVRVDRFLFEELYCALHRFKDMRTLYILPNLWLIAMDMPAFFRTDQNEGDIQISKEKWLRNIFTNTSNTLSQHENQTIQSRYDFINKLFPKIDAVNIDYLPRALLDNDEKLDIYNILRNESSKEFYTSLQIAVNQLLSNGGKRLPGCPNSRLFIRPAELTALMSDLIDVFNENKMPNADAVINRYLLTHFKNEIVQEQMAQFQTELFQYVHNIIDDTMTQPQTPGTINTIDNQIKDERHRLTKKYLAIIIDLARDQIHGLDAEVSDNYLDIDQQKKALLELPKLIQEEVKIIEAQMNGYYEPEFTIEKKRQNLVIEDLQRQRVEQQALLKETKEKLKIKQDLFHREKRINNSLKYPKPVRAGLAPCKNCERDGGAINYTHWKKDCPSKRTGNFYYYNQEDERMVCDACRQVLNIKEQRIECGRCGGLRKVTRFFKFNE
jgi:hypothetical protein